MLKFRPIVYSDDDLRAYKYTGPTSIQEGYLCRPWAASSSVNVAACTLAKFAAFPTMPGSSQPATIDLKARTLVFPVYREEPDPENIGATITQNQYVIGMHLHVGSEFEVHKSVVTGATLKPFTAGCYVTAGTSGKFEYYGGSYDSEAVLGVCMGTFNSTWLRVRCI